ncbi:unnamed protein product [Urochloa humidicola]
MEVLDDEVVALIYTHGRSSVWLDWWRAARLSAVCGFGFGGGSAASASAESGGPEARPIGRGNNRSKMAYHRPLGNPFHLVRRRRFRWEQILRAADEFGHMSTHLA